MEFLKTRSKVLIISTIFSISVGVIAILNSLYGIWNAFTPENKGTLVISLLFALPLIAIIFGVITLVIAIFEILTAWYALKTNKKSLHIWNVILNIILIFGGISLYLFSKSDSMMNLICECTFWALILRIFGYFNQKKINEKNNKEENKNEFIR